MENKQSRLLTVQETIQQIKREYIKSITPISLAIIFAFSPTVKLANAQTIITTPMPDAADLVIEKYFACTARDSDNNLYANIRFNTKNIGTDASTVSYSSVGIIAGPPETYATFEVKDLQPDESVSFTKQIPIDKCKNGDCDGNQMEVEFMADAIDFGEPKPGLVPELDEENNWIIINAQTCLTEQLRDRDEFVQRDGYILPYRERRR